METTIPKGVALLREKMLEETLDCVLYNGWPCLTCITHAIKTNQLPQKFWEASFPDWFTDEHFDAYEPFDPADKGHVAWDIVFDSYMELTDEYVMRGYRTQEEWREIMKTSWEE